MADIKTKAREVRDRGFCILEGVYGADDCAEMREIMQRGQRERGIEQLTGGIHPLLQHAPDMAPFFARGEVAIDTIAEVFQDEVHLAHSGAKIQRNGDFEGVQFLCPWHHHCEDWYITVPANENKVERVLCNIYADGSKLRCTK